MARRSLAADVKEGILKDLAAGVRAAEIATKYGVSVPTVFNYKNRAAGKVKVVAPVEEVENTTGC